MGQGTRVDTTVSSRGLRWGWNGRELGNKLILDHRRLKNGASSVRFSLLEAAVGEDAFMARSPSVKPIISAEALKGYLLEEAVAYLIKNAGYRLLTRPEDDVHDLVWRSNGLRVRGRGGFHQADVLGEFRWAPAFSNPIRLFIEAKWRSGRSKIGIGNIREAVGVLQDTNQALSMLPPRIQEINESAHNHAEIITGRSFSYAYRFMICATAGFSSDAQIYALAHQISLLDLSHEDFSDLRQSIDQTGDRLSERLIEEAEMDGSRITSQAQAKRGIRATLRASFWQTPQHYQDQHITDELRPLIRKIEEIEELFIGVSATGFVILLKADDPQVMVRHMSSAIDPSAEFYFSSSRGPTDWTLIVTGNDLPRCRLSFTLPEMLLVALEDKLTIDRRLALDFKQQHFSFLTVYRVTANKSLICTLKIKENWVRELRERR